MAIGQKGIRAGRAYVELGVDDRMAAGLRKAQARLKAFGAAVTGAGLKMMGLGAAIVAPLIASAKAFSTMGDNIAKMARRTGMSVEALSALQFAAQRSGTDIESLETGIKRMQRTIYDAGRDLSTATDALDDLGLKFKDIDGLAPEEQFKLLADRLSRIEDPTKKAAIALMLFGRAGTMLLPMIEGGAAKMNSLTKEAKRLGLVMSDEDAAAAEKLNDAMGDVMSTIKMGVFRVGAALTPLLEALSKKIADIISKINGWINANRGLVISALKIGAAVIGAGVALVVLGGLIKATAIAFGILATAVSVAGIALSIIKAALLAIITPIGLVIAVIAGLGAYVIYASGLAGKALAWLGGKFDSLKSDAIDAYRGIGDAMVAGDIGLAAKIMWLTLKKQWLVGTEGLRKAWANMWFGIRVLQEIAIHGLTKGILTAVTIWRKALAHTKGFLADIANTAKMIGREIAIELDTNLSPAEKEVRIRESRAAAGPEFTAIEAEKNAALTAAEELHRFQMKLADQEHQRNLAAIANESQTKLDAIDAEIAATKKALKEAIAGAAGSRKASEGAGPPALGKARDFFEGLDDVLAKATVGVAGTFYAAQARGMGAGGAAERTANGVAEISRNTKRLVDMADENGLVFAP